MHGSRARRACATLVGMRRIAWPLLSAVLLIAGAGRRTTHGPAHAGRAPSNKRSRTLDAGRHRLAATPVSRGRRRRARSRPRAWFGLGKSYEALARESFQKLQTTAPDSAWEASIVAEVLVSSERFAQALSVYREVQQAEPEIGGVHEAIADLYERAGKREWATAERAKAAARPRDCATRAAECGYLAGKYLDVIAASRRSCRRAVALLGHARVQRAGHRGVCDARDAAGVGRSARRPRLGPTRSGPAHRGGCRS